MTTLQRSLDLAQMQQQLDAPFTLTPEQKTSYRENGYIKLKHVLEPQLLEHYRQAISARVAELSADVAPLDQRSTYGKAFLQIMNLWTESAPVREFVFGKRLARIAAELMGVTGVRIYHDQALYKEPGGGITPWHADQYYWPVSTDNMVTAWVPLQSTPLEMGPLALCRGSHRVPIGRDLEISDESEATLERALQPFPVDDSGFDLGEVSFHSGWTFHRAGANRTTRPREVMTVIYMDEAMTLAPPRNRDQENDTRRWCPGIEPGQRIASPLNPVVYSAR